MPMPASDTPWPPPQIVDVLDQLRLWDAWYVGDTGALATAYSPATRRVRPSQLDGGVVGAAARFWWGRPQPAQGADTRRLHIPLAADICQASSDLLYAEPPTFTMPGGAARGADEALAELVAASGTVPLLARSAEYGAALGGHYLRVVVDPSVSPSPFLDRVDPDCAVPLFRWGRLAEVTFWHVVRRDAGRVWRHLEHHSTGPAGWAQIEHALWVGTDERLGARAPFEGFPELEALPVDAASSTYLPVSGLGVVYIPNLTPAGAWRAHPVCAPYGRSDLWQLDGLLDSLDEAWSSWMRELDLGKARVFASEHLLQTSGPGRGATIDLDRAIITAVKHLPAEGGDTRLPLELIQPLLRIAEHAQTVESLTKTILRTAGYSSATFGDLANDATITATEVQARDRRSLTTRDRKIREAAGAVGQAVGWLAQAAGYGDGTPVEVSYPPAVQRSEVDIAQTEAALRAAGLRSLELGVRTVNPDMTDDQVTAEVAAIIAETAVPDPASWTPQDPTLTGPPVS